MAERKPGPVKPPVIDLVARDASVKPEPETAKDDVTWSEPAADPEVSPASAEAARPGFAFRMPEANWVLLAGVAVGGAVLGTLLTYLLAGIWALPSPLKPLPDLSPQLTEQQSQLDGFETRLSGLEGAATRTQVSLDATIAQLDAGLTEVKKSVDDLRASIPAPTSVDLSGIEGELATLKTRIDAIAAGATGTDVDTISTSIATLQSGIDAVTKRIDGVDGRLSAVDGTLSSLRTDLDATKTALTAHISSSLPAETGPALKLPLILSSLDSAFGAGKPFEAELASLKTIMPDAAISPALQAAATTGLSRPDALFADFEAVLPQMLAAQDGPEGSWTDNTINWLKGIIALRPATETDGNTPEAVVTRLEAAMERRDYAGAVALLALLPPDMVTASGAVAGEIAAHADADQLLAALRAQALASGTEATP